MNKSSLLKQTLLVAALSTATATCLMAQADPSSPSSSQPGRQRYGSSSTSDRSSTSQVQKINKASELIGMNVKNQQGETLGEIKDVVIDFSGDKVGYVVLKTDKGVLSAEQLHAVPLRAFQPSADGMSLTLNADKEKIASSQGFTKDNWPNPSNPSWGAQPFWQESGQPGSSQYRQQNRESQRDTSPGSRSSSPPSPDSTTP